MLTLAFHASRLLFGVWMVTAAGPAAAVAEDPQRALLAELDAAWAARPGDIGVAYIAARTAERLADPSLRDAWFARLWGLSFDHALDEADFATSRASAGYRAWAERFAGRAKRVQRAVEVLQVDAVDLLPEGTAYDARRDRFLLSSGRQRTVFAVDRAGHATPLGANGAGGLYAVLGMQVDAVRDRLWVATTAAPFMVDFRAEDAGRARLGCLDLATGDVLAVLDAPLPGAMLNDLALAKDGSLAVTDSNHGTVYRWTPAGELPGAGGVGSLEPLLPTGSLDSPNGIVALAGGDLVVADFQGLVLLRGAALTRLAPPPGIYLGGIDGLAVVASGAAAGAADRPLLVGIQNVVGQGRVWRLELDLDNGRVARAEVLETGNPLFANPTTGVIVDGGFYFLANPRLQDFDPEGRLRPPPAGARHVLLRQPLDG
jgi:hypothetical protein